VGALHTLTYVTSDEAGACKFLTDGMGLSASEWFIPSLLEKPELDAYFGFKSSENWKACSFHRVDDGANIQIRLFVVSSNNPQIRPEVDGTYLGGLSIGFPLINTDKRESHMTSLGFPSVVGVKRMEFTGPEGETYVSEEVHFTGPENIYVMAVQRPDVFVPVGPLNNDAEIGAPAYSAQCVQDCDAAITFYKDVLGYEIRRDMSMEVGDNSGLKLRKGSQERFVQAFAPGTRSGYIILLDHGEDRKRAANMVNFGPPNRGLTMWSMPTRNIMGVRDRAEKAGVTCLQPLSAVTSPFLPHSDTLILEDPNGFPVEIFSV